MVIAENGCRTDLEGVVQPLFWGVDAVRRRNNRDDARMIIDEVVQLSEWSGVVFQHFLGLGVVLSVVSGSWRGSPRRAARGHGGTRHLEEQYDGLPLRTIVQRPVGVG